MKIKLMIFFVIMVSGLQASEKQITLRNVIQLAISKRSAHNYAPIVVYGDKQLVDNTQGIIDDQLDSIIESFSDENNKELSVMIFSSFNPVDRIIWRKGLPEDFNKWATVSDNKYEDFIEYLKTQKGLVVVNLYENHGLELAQRHTQEIDNLIRRNDIALIIGVHPEYQSFNLEQLFEFNEITPIVYNKPTTCIVL